MRPARVKQAALALSALAVLLVAGAYVSEEDTETCLSCGAVRTRVVRRFAGVAFTSTRGAFETRASEVYGRLVGGSCDHLWGGGPSVTTSHFLFIPTGSRQADLPGEMPGWRHTLRVIAAMSRLDDPTAAKEMHAWLIPGRPSRGELSQRYVEQLEECSRRFHALFPRGEIPDPVSAGRFRALKGEAAPEQAAPSGPFRLTFVKGADWSPNHPRGFDEKLGGYHLTGDIATIRISPAAKPLPEKLVLAVSTSPGAGPMLEGFTVSAGGRTLRTSLRSETVEIISDAADGSARKTEEAPRDDYLMFDVALGEVRVTFMPKAMSLLEAECTVSWVDWYRR